MDAVGLAAGLDDVGVEGDTVDDGAAKPLVSEGFRPFGKRGVGRGGDRAAFFPVGEQLEQQFRAGLVQLELAELVDLCRPRHRLIYTDPGTADQGAA